MHDGAGRRFGVVDVQVHAPLRGGQNVARIGAGKIHRNNKLFRQVRVGNTGWGDKETVLRAGADISRRSARQSANR